MIPVHLLRCPKCRNQMKYDGRVTLGMAKKRCVYCNHTFKVKEHIVQQV